MVLLPLISIALGLFRPDGVIIGVVATLIGFSLISRQNIKYYTLACFFAVSIGVLYFIWRWNYFGDILPLPLYVKSSTDVYFPGLAKNLGWMTTNIVPILLSIVLIFTMKKNRYRLVLATVPSLILLIALTFAVQSQNIAGRFQGPLTINILMMSAIFMSRIRLRANWSKSSSILTIASILIFALASVGVQSRLVYRTVKYLGNTDYINFFPYLAKGAFGKGSVIALTEAGRFGYWVPGRKYDLVGLNTAETAKYGASPEFISKIDPDVIFIHVAWMAPYVCPTGDYCTVTKRDLESILDGTDTTSYKTRKNRVERSVLATFEFLRHTKTDYVLMFVRYGTDFSHFYAIKRNGKVNLNKFRTALALSFTTRGRKSYWQMKTP